jgi:hypothetical protein
MQGLGLSVLRVGFMFNMMESAFMRQEMAAMMAENAQNRLNDAIARYGANSEQARRAAKQNETEMQYLNNANIRANVSMGLVATQLILQSNLLKTATLAEMAHTAAKYGGIIASGLHTAARYVEAAAIWVKNHAMAVEVSLEAALAPYLVPIMLGAAAAATAGIAASVATMPSKQEGGYVTETRPYLLHAGERVLSSKEAKTFVSKETFKSLQTGGLVEKEGLYHLHTGEKVLSKESVKNNENATSLSSTFKESTFTRNNTNNIEKSALREHVVPSLDAGGTITREGVYNLGVGETVIPAGGDSTLSTFNFETHLHIETDLDAALNEQNRRIKNEYRRNAP